MVKKNKNIRNSDEDIIRGFNEYKGDYLPIDKDRLVLFVVDYLESRGIEVTFDKLVVASFKLFPKKFSLVGFPEYPDAKTVNDCIFLHCVKTKGWVAGNAQTGYKITEKGKYFLDEAKKMLEGKIKVTRKYGTIPRRKEFTFINSLKKTPAYKKFLKNKGEEISTYEIFECLKASQNSKEIAKKHLEKFLEYAERINDSHAIEFLKFIKRRLEG